MAEKEKTEGQEEGLSPKRSKKPLVAAGIVVAVLAVAVVGFGVWHNSPSFCNECHSFQVPEGWE